MVFSNTRLSNVLEKNLPRRKKAFFGQCFASFFGAVTKKGHRQHPLAPTKQISIQQLSRLTTSSLNDKNWKKNRIFFFLSSCAS
jgi:hypothetical protein